MGSGAGPDSGKEESLYHWLPTQRLRSAVIVCVKYVKWTRNE